MNHFPIPAQNLHFDQALAHLLMAANPLSETEKLPLASATGRILATAIHSAIDIPTFTNSAMDGYAVRLSDFNDQTFPLILPIAGRALAGTPFTQTWPAGSCIRIMTGAPIPAGTDAVVVQEQTELSEQGIIFHQCPLSGANIRLEGEEIQKGDMVMAVGKKLTGATLPLLAALGVGTVEVFRPLRVAIFSSGDELQSVGQPLQKAQIYDVNRLMLKVMLEKLHCNVIDFGIIKDDPHLLEKTLLDAAEQADLVLSSGGVSVGDADHIKHLLTRLATVKFWQVAMRPGKPFVFAQLRETLFCGLPGNSVSATVTFYHLVQPLIMKLAGLQDWITPPQFKVQCSDPIRKRAGRLEFQRGFLTVNAAGQLTVSAAKQQESHRFSTFHENNCFIILEQERAHVSAGEWVTVTPFNHLLQE